MVAAFDYCLHGKGGAAPSIDTAMHGLVDAAHVDHLHPDSGIAIATAADGEALTKEIFGDKVVWVPWRRPGFQLGLDIAAIKEAEPAGRSAASSAATASPPGATPARRPRRTRCGSSTPPRRYIAEHSQGRARSVPRARGVRRPARGRAPRQGRRARPDASAASPRRTARWSATSPTPTSCSTSSATPSTRAWPSSAPRAPTTSCAPRSSRWCSTCPPTPRSRRSIARLAGAARGLPRGLPGATTTATPALGGSRPRSAARTR